MPTILHKLMRHESIDTTMRYYVGVNANALQTSCGVNMEQATNLARSASKSHLSCLGVRSVYVACDKKIGRNDRNKFADKEEHYWSLKPDGMP